MYFMTLMAIFIGQRAPSAWRSLLLRRRSFWQGFEEYAAVRERGSRRPQAIITGD